MADEEPKVAIPPNLVRHHRTWIVRIKVPTDLVPRLHRSVLVESTGEHDLRRATIAAEPIRARMKSAIEAARKGLTNDPEATAKALEDRLIRRYRATLGPDSKPSVEEMMTFAVTQLSNSPAARRRREEDDTAQAARLRNRYAEAKKVHMQSEALEDMLDFFT
jgi:hypothetical protein